MKLLLIKNPVAGRHTDGRALRKLDALLAEHQIDVTECQTQKHGDAMRIAQDADETFDMIACVGGDGTLSEVVAGVASRAHRPAIGYVPYGTSNDLAKTLRMPTQPTKAGDLLIHGSPRPMDIGHMEGQHFTYIASFGTFSEVVYETPQHVKNRLGKLAYVLYGARRLPRLKSYTATISHDHGQESGEYALLAVTNARTSAGGFIRYRETETATDDGLFEMLIVRKPRTLLHTLWVLLKMTLRVPDAQYISRLQSKHFDFTFDTAVPWCLDGEKGGAWKAVHIDVLPSHVRVMQPMKSD